MEIVQLLDKKFQKYISSEEIDNRLQEIANQINEDYVNKDVYFIGILNGAFMVMSDLIKKVNLNCTIKFIRVSSYDGMKSKGAVKLLLGLDEELKGKHVVIVEDIVDTGLTMQYVCESLQQHEPASLKIASLLMKPEVYKGSIKIDYLCFPIPNKFVVGYGLDYDGLGRNLKDIYQLVEE